MKRFQMLLTLITLSLVQPLLTFSQSQPQKVRAKVDVTDDGIYKNAIRMNLLNALFNYPSFTYERFVSPHLSLLLDASLRSSSAGSATAASSGSSLNYDNNQRRISSVVLHPTVRLYVYQDDKNRLNTYASFYYKYRYFKSVNDYPLQNTTINGTYTLVDYDNTYIETTNGAGMLLGTCTNRSSRIVADFFVGTQFLSTRGTFDFKDKNVNYDLFRSDIGPRSVTDAFSIMNVNNFRCGFTLGVKF
jgi:hypothetical protein